jgi:hypothetical protein
MYLWLQASSEELETLINWKPGVHKGVDVVLPRDVEYTLSLNLKYLFPVTERKTVAYEWFEELVRKCRLRWIFRDKPQTFEGLESQLPYTRNPSFNPVVSELWFNRGVSNGRSLLHLQMERAIPKTLATDDVFSRLTVPPKTLVQYLTGARLLSFISDKNLGIVVTTRHWYEQEIQKFLDLPVFEPFLGNFGEFHESTCHGLKLLNKDDFGRFRPFITKKIEKFLNECWIKRDIPQFHGIPKIHKNPWKLRPIVPMHSFVTSQLGILLHHMLLPVQRSLSWICESSKNLALEVAEFNSINRQYTRIHTGDVSAMYTSIKWAIFRGALLGILESGNWFDEQTRHWIIEAANFLWTHTVFQTGPRLIKQIDGIPMGIHCGPVFANLFMGYFENVIFQGLFGPLDPRLFYRRYLDDVFVLHPLDEQVESFISCPGLVITWQHSAAGLPFLDVFFHNHLGCPEVCFRPYEKALNHHQYLPWVSSHPPSVKKGLMKGELSRIRSICRKKPYFMSWKATFVSRLRMRGWPVRVLKAWGRQVQWRDNHAILEPVSAENSAIISVSEYNPVWEKISSSDIWQTMQTTWRQLGPSDLPFPSRCLIAKKRTRSLWDLLRSVNRNLLKQEIEEITIEDLSDAMSTLSSSLPFAPPLALSQSGWAAGGLPAGVSWDVGSPQ